MGILRRFSPPAYLYRSNHTIDPHTLFWPHILFSATCEAKSEVPLISCILVQDQDQDQDINHLVLVLRFLSWSSQQDWRYQQLNTVPASVYVAGSQTVNCPTSNGDPSFHGSRARDATRLYRTVVVVRRRSVVRRQSWAHRTPAR